MSRLLRSFLPRVGFCLEQPRLVETDSQLVGEGLIESDLLGAERALPREDQPERSYDLVAGWIGTATHRSCVASAAFARSAIRSGRSGESCMTTSVLR